MFNRPFLSTSIRALIFTLALSACGKTLHVNVPNSGNANAIEPPAGNTRLKQTTGNGEKSGTDGKNGIDGKNGSKLLIGKTDPEKGSGTEGDVYFNAESGDIFQKQATLGWVKQGNLKGPKGDRGDPGKCPVIIAKAGMKDSNSIPVDAFYIDTTTGKLYTRNADNALVFLLDLKGDKGADGTMVLDGKVAPTASEGRVGDYFINLENGDFFKKDTATSWKWLKNLMAGFNSALENRFRLGSGIPLSASIAPRGLYIDVLTGNLYGKLSDGTVQVLLSFKPQAFQAGGRTAFLEGGHPPVDSFGNGGDLYLDSFLSELYRKDEDGQWKSILEFKGPKGEHYGVGKTAPISMSPGMNEYASAPKGSLYLDTSTGNLYFRHADEAPELLMNLVGANSTTGTTLLIGKEVPATGLGRNGDYYLNQTNNDYFKKQNDTTWIWVMNFTLSMPATKTDSEVKLRSGQHDAHEGGLVTPLPLPISVLSVRVPDVVLSLEPIVVTDALGKAQLGFETGISTPNKFSSAKLSDVASLLKKNSSSIEEIQVVGNCDKSGTVAGNKLLSLKRAKRVQNLLIKGGVGAKLFLACRGDGAPAQSSCGSDEKCPHDRRVDIDVTLKANIDSKEKSTIVNTLNQSFQRIWKKEK